MVALADVALKTGGAQDKTRQDKRLHSTRYNTAGKYIKLGVGRVQATLSWYPGPGTMVLTGSSSHQAGDTQ